LLYLAVLAAFFVISLRVPPSARDFGYYVNGFVLIMGITFLGLSGERR